jgi:hypothetical protein
LVIHLKANPTAASLSPVTTRREHASIRKIIITDDATTADWI